MLSHRDFDSNHNWAHTIIPSTLKEIIIHFIYFNRSSTQIHSSPSPVPFSLTSLLPTQQVSFNIVLTHFRTTSSIPPLRILIQGTSGTGRSHLIDFLKDTFLVESAPNSSSFFLLAPTSVTKFNIKVLTINYSLRIPLVSMHPLEGKPLLHLQ